MDILNAQTDLKLFMQSVRNACERVLMLDYDGTLAPFSVRRNDAVPYEGVEEVLNVIMAQRDSRVVIVSGRRAAEIGNLLHLKKRPEVWGSHGWERVLEDGSYIMHRLPEDAGKALDDVRSMLTKETEAGYCEQKPASVAVHWRGLESKKAEELQCKAEGLLAGICLSSELEAAGFDGGMEFRVPGRDKGAAVETILSECHVGAAAAYLGDDMTDEDAFSSMGRRGLSVLVRRELRETSAGIRISPPGELRDFLHAWCRACEGKRGTEI